MSEKEWGQAAGQVWDVVVVGGGVAGLSAALTLARVRRSVLVIDEGEPRNAPASAAHGLLSRDGIAPLELLRLAREEVASYSGRIVSGRVEGVRREGERLVVGTDDGRRTLARRVLVTTGLVDELPGVPGLAQRWGRDVLHCPYCHGWEVREAAVGVLGTGPAAFHQALLFRQLSSEVTLFLHTGGDLAGEQWEQLAALGVGVVDGEVRDLDVDDQDRLSGVRLASGRSVAVDALVVAPRFVARAGFLAELGLPVTEHPMGLGVRLVTDEAGFTGVEGVWAAGNVTDLLAGVPAAAASGTRAAAAINMDLIGADAKAAVTARAGGVFSGAMEAEASRRVLGDRRHGLDSLLHPRPGSGR
ncbi:NAD(P)/FAD-dependent oxidoreductase [Streptomyces acidicola]|uniref:NAD(P)/FAD-dependent oxidoreductase n=1 Tax=Streptomyces acidicola TaxID=2596892 RepID=A0A5N8X2G8_9ACTN|nr:NAD(P)/FAD-dependent oxidoreductase [Streptomyces acidicola]MPY53214.1 NAD(P)/FAD-dependent oxidoreductase [Streptomyces acidicola]